jgi:hypothetical protein
VHVHLAGGQADAGRGVHGFEHVVEQALEVRRGNLRGIDRTALVRRRGSGNSRMGSMAMAVSVMEAPVRAGKTRAL